MSRVAVVDADELRSIVTSTLAEMLDGFSPGAPAHEVMTRAEAAEFLRCSLPQLDRLIRLQGLPFHVLGDSRRFLRSELISWLTSGSASQSSHSSHSQKEPDGEAAGHSAPGTRGSELKKANDSKGSWRNGGAR
jgi:excisionase family DNA binding protein